MKKGRHKVDTRDAQGNGKGTPASKKEKKQRIQNSVQMEGVIKPFKSR